MMPRREFPTKVRAAAFQRANGHCEECTAKLYPAKFHFDHIIPDAFGGDPVLSNCACLCLACHGKKTAQRDVPAVSKSNRVRAKHIGAKLSGYGFRKAPGQHTATRPIVRKGSHL